MRRLRPLSETECQTRLYGGWERSVRVVPRASPARAPGGSLAGDAIRRLFEAKLESRPPEAEPEAA